MKKVLCVVLMGILSLSGSLWAAGDEPNIPLLALKMIESEKIDDPVDVFRNTALHLAAKKGLVDIVQTLLDQGADPNAVNVTGDTPLHEATYYCKNDQEAQSYADIIKLLIEYGANPDAKTIQDYRIQSAETPLGLAVPRSQYQGTVLLVKTLLESGADPNFRTGDLDETVLHIAIARSSTKYFQCLLKLLLEHKADPTIENSCNETPVCMAARLGRIEALKLLLPYITDEIILNEALKAALVSGQIYEDRIRTAIVELLYNAGGRPVSASLTKPNAPRLSVVAINNDYNPELLQHLLDWYLDFEQNTDKDNGNVVSSLTDLIPQLKSSLEYHRLLRVLNALFGHSLGRKHCIPTIVEINNNMEITDQELSSLELALRLLSELLSNSNFKPENEQDEDALKQMGDKLISMLSDDGFMTAIGNWELDFDELHIGHTIDQALLLAKKLIEAFNFTGNEAKMAQIVLIAKVLEAHTGEWRATQKKSSRSDRLNRECLELDDTEDPENTEEENKEETEEVWELTETEAPMNNDVLRGTEISEAELLENLMREGGIHRDYDRIQKL
ncbi:MAG TPA: hypothetical protein DIU37_01480 [Opitutae bacterium]|nr:hypothetical protein [Opitutae bacterium]